jgi:CubicO group peptidase (beta-lactamase class C family)
MPQSKDVNATVQRAIDAAVASGREIGVQVAAYLGGRLVVDAWGGVADPASGRPVDGNTLFNVYSVTKAVAATAVHMLVDRGQLDYDAPVVRTWPEYGAHGKEKTTLRDVLTHRAAVPRCRTA